jgi:hypothetical protein
VNLDSQIYKAVRECDPKGKKVSVDKEKGVTDSPYPSYNVEIKRTYLGAA